MNPTVSSLDATTVSTADFTSSHDVTLTLVCDQSVVVGGTPELQLSDGSTATYVGISADGLTLTFTYAATSAPGVLTVNALTGGTIADGDGNALSGLVNDTISPYSATIDDLAANIAANFDSLEAAASHIAAIEFTDVGTPFLSLTAAQLASDGNLLSKIAGPYDLNITGVTGQPYTSYTEVFDASDRRIEETLYRSDGSVDEVSIFNADGSYSQTYEGITGEPYTSYTDNYNTSGKLTQETLYRSDGSIEELSIYNADGSHSQTYEGITGQAYTSYTDNYNTSGMLTKETLYRSDGSVYARTYEAITGQPYTSYTDAYNTSGTLTRETRYRADGSVQELSIFNADGTRTNTFEGITGKAYTSYTDTYNASGKLTQESLYRADGSIYETSVFNADSSKEVVFEGVTGKPYVAYGYMYNSSGKLTQEVFARADSSIYMTETFKADGSAVATYEGITGMAYSSYSNFYSSSGALTQQVLYRSDGTIFSVPVGSAPFTPTTPAPGIAYVGEPILVNITPQQAGYSYNALTYVDGAWQFGPWTSWSTAVVTPTKTGASGLDVYVLDKSTNSLVLNQWLGQYNVYNQNDVTALAAPISRLQIEEVDSDVSMQASQAAWRSSIDTFQQLQDYVQNQFLASDASESAPGLSSAVDQGLYYMQFVSGLWAYGNALFPLQPGAVLQNEETGVTAGAEATVSTYLNSPIGCCTDYAAVLAVLLSEAGINNYIIGDSTHVFNEAELDGQWWTLDANLDTAYDDPWSSVIDTSTTPLVLKFADAGMEYGSSNYRPELGEFYNFTMESVADGVFPTSTSYDTVSWLDSLPDGQLFESLGYTVGEFSGGVADTGPIADTPNIGSFTVTQFDQLTSSTSAAYRFQVADVHGSVSQDAAAADWRSGIDTFQELRDYIHSQFLANGSDENEPGLSQTVSEALYDMQWVSGLWQYDSTATNNPTSVSDYLALSTASDADFASVLAAVLIDGGFTTKIVTDAGHVVDEVNLGGKWWTLDPTLGLAYNDTWSNVISSHSTPLVLSFDDAGRLAGSSEYSADLAAYYAQTIELVGNGSLFNFTELGSADYLSSLPDAQLFQNEIGPTGTFAQPASWTMAGNNGHWYVGDFNGDGKTDIARLTSGGVAAQVFESNGSSFVSAGTWTLGSTAATQWYVGDFNGDGKSDIAANVPGAGLKVSLSSGSTFSFSGVWTSSTASNWLVGDFTGDGKDDVAAVLTGGGLEAYSSTGTAFTDSGKWTNTTASSWIVGDFNGDGKDDVATEVSGVGLEVYLSTGSGFTDDGVWTTATPGATGWQVGDFNGDGKADVLTTLPGQSTTEVYLSGGSSFKDSGNWTQASSGSGPWYVGDFNGDGSSDVFSYLAGTSGAYTYLSQPDEPDKNFAGVAGQKDTFAFLSRFGHDTVTNFDATSVNKDVVEFAKALAPSYSAVIADAAQVGTNVVITLDPAESLTINNTILGSLSTGNFKFV
jgi:hypothetical protein